MAQRRMFSNRIINSAKFLQMPEGSQLLYFHLILRADDDGVAEAYPVMKLLGTAPDNFKILLAKGLIKQLNEDQVVVITDWLEHNSIRADRKVDSMYKELLVENNIPVIEPKARSDVTDNSRRLGGQSTDGIGKDRLGKVSIGKTTTAAQLKELFYFHPLFASLKTKYPNRDYDHQFALMCDWWLTHKKKLPVSITALENWLRNTKPDPEIEGERRRRDAAVETQRKLQEMAEIPKGDPAKIEALKAKMAGIGKSI